MPLMTALAVGSRLYGGSEEVAVCLRCWAAWGEDLPGWQAALAQRDVPARADIWRPLEHAPGFDPNGESCPTPVRQTLDVLAAVRPGRSLTWLRAQRPALEAAAGAPLAMTGVIAAACRDLQLDEHQAAMLVLMLRLPGAAVQALEQRARGWRQFPFFGRHIHLTDDPGRRDGARIISHQRLLHAENRLDTVMGKAFLSERVVLRGQDLHHDLADLDWFGLHLFGITGRRFSREACELLGYLWACTTILIRRSGRTTPPRWPDRCGQRPGWRWRRGWSAPKRACSA